MRFLLPAAAAVALAAGTTPALATASHSQRHTRPERVRSHLSLHVSRHAVLRGERVVVRGRLRPGGGFRARFSPEVSGNYALRAYGSHDRRHRAAASPPRRLTAYRQAGASYYGPGLYGSGVACGGILLPGTLGVANKTLPCGTRVKLRYRGRTVTVPVIDRGPYVAGRDYDLTAATRARLGFPGVGTVLADH